MKSQPVRARRSALQHLPKAKRNPKVPESLAVYLYLPGVGSLLDYEWNQPAVEIPADVHPTALSPEQYEVWAATARKQLATSTKSKKPATAPTKPTLAAQLLADPDAMRSFLAGQQYVVDYFKATGKPVSFLDCSGALSGGAR
jgi:hypothetical protein